MIDDNDTEPTAADFAPPAIVEAKTQPSRRGTAWLAGELHVSRARARRLLAQGRILGARKDPQSGTWDLSELLAVSVKAGKRGPALGKRPARTPRNSFFKPRLIVSR